MKIKLFNLCLPVRLAIEALGASTVKVVDAINAQRGETTQVDSKYGERANVKTKKDKDTGVLLFSGVESVQFKYEGELNIVRKIDVFNSAVEKLHKAFPFPGSMPLPDEMAAWVTDKCVTKPEADKEATGKPGKSKADKVAKPEPEAAHAGKE